MSERYPDPRAAAARNVHQVAFGGRSLDALMAPRPEAKSAPRPEAKSAPAEPNARDERDERLVRELTYGSIRHFFSLRDLVDQALDKPHSSLDSLVLCLLIVGTYQLRHTRIPDYAAVSATVKATRRLRKGWASRLVNSVLRRLVATPADDEGTSDEQARFDHPSWLIAALRRDYPDDWQSILNANNSRAPLCLRINQTRQRRSAYLEFLEKQGLSARPGLTPEALTLESPRPVATLPGYANGAISVQDQGAQLAAGLLEAEPGQRVLDACAAPGGKAQHLLETVPRLDLLVLDVDPDRVAAMRAEFVRLGLDPECSTVGDATRLDWWDGRPFDRILLDAPCSGTGTLRRHPDIKLLKSAGDLTAFQAIQRKLAATVWETLGPGGILLYCTCSILSVENDAVLDAFLASHPDARPMPIDAPWGRATRYGRQLIPTDGGPDGFYYARLSRDPAPTPTSPTE